MIGNSVCGGRNMSGEKPPEVITLSSDSEDDIAEKPNNSVWETRMKAFAAKITILECDYCKQRFSDSDELKLHFRRTHPNMTEKEVKANELEVFSWKKPGSNRSKKAKQGAYIYSQVHSRHEVSSIGGIEHNASDDRLGVAKTVDSGENQYPKIEKGPKETKTDLCSKEHRRKRKRGRRKKSELFLLPEYRSKRKQQKTVLEKARKASAKKRRRQVSEERERECCFQDLQLPRLRVRSDERYYKDTSESSSDSENEEYDDFGGKMRKSHYKDESENATQGAAKKFEADTSTSSTTAAETVPLNVPEETKSDTRTPTRDEISTAREGTETQDTKKSLAIPYHSVMGIRMCEVCRKHWTKYMFDRHVLEEHMIRKQYQCIYCVEKPFFSFFLQEMLTHIRHQHGDRVRKEKKKKQPYIDHTEEGTQHFYQYLDEFHKAFLKCFPGVQPLLSQSVLGREVDVEKEKIKINNETVKIPCAQRLY